MSNLQSYSFINVILTPSYTRPCLFVLVSEVEIVTSQLAQISWHSCLAIQYVKERIQRFPIQTFEVQAVHVQSSQVPLEPETDQDNSGASMFTSQSIILFIYNAENYCFQGQSNLEQPHNDLKVRKHLSTAQHSFSCYRKRDPRPRGAGV